MFLNILIFTKMAKENVMSNCTVFENHRKSFIQHCELRLHFEWTKVY